MNRRFRGAKLPAWGCYWSNLVRPGDQIDQVVNPNLLPFAPLPSNGVPGPVTSIPVPADLGNTLLTLIRETWRQGCDTLLRTVPKWSVQSASSQRPNPSFRMGVQG
jgi:hypothetical protein